MANPVCAIVGFGPGLGTAYADTFLGAGYDLTLLSRSGASLPAESSRGRRVAAYGCDAAEPAALRDALGRAARDLGPVQVLIYNADLAMFGTLDDISEDGFEQSWRVGVLGLYAAARALGPEMTRRGSGSIIVSGATASLRGRPLTAAFAPTKASQRVLAQSLAKHLGPQGVHVAYLIIDGVIDTENTRTNFAPDKPDSFFLQPQRIAEAALQLVRQDPSAWTFEMDLRPSGENW